ncbi:MAG: vgr related protein [Novosphingobium sp.]
MGAERPLTGGEIALVRSVFGDAVDCAPVRIRRRRWFPLQPRGTLMAPCGHIHFHPASPWYCDDFAQASIDLKGLFLHEITHVWQTQKHGRLWLVLMRHPFCRYDYSLKPGWPLTRYGIEQQAEIVRHAFLLRSGATLPGVGDGAAYDLLVNFPVSTSPIE